MMTVIMIIILSVLCFLYVIAEIHRERRINEMYEIVQSISQKNVDDKDEQILLYSKYIIEEFRNNRRPHAYSEWKNGLK